MATSVGDLLGAAGAGAEKTTLAETSLTRAIVHVDRYIADTLVDPADDVPAEAYDGAVLQCALDLFQRRTSPFGQQMVPDSAGNMVPTRIGADPLASVRPLLHPWCLDIGMA